MNTKILEELGFTHNEVRVYFALFELGESTVGPIAQTSDVTLSKVYPLLAKLIKKGLVSEIIKSGVKHFKAFHPDRLIDYLEEKKKEIISKENQVKEIIPLLLAKQKQQAEQSAMVYETLNGIKTLYNQIMDYLEKEKEDFIGFTLGQEYKDKNVNLFFKNYDAKRLEKGIKTKLIGLKSQKNFLEKEYGKSKNVEIRYVDYSVPTGIIIFGDKIATLVFNEVPTAFVIQSQQTADAYRKFFNDLWGK